MAYDAFRRELDAQLQQVFVDRSPSMDRPDAWAPGGSGITALSDDLQYGFAAARDRAEAPASGAYDSQWERACHSEWERLGHTTSRTLTDSQIVRFSVQRAHEVFEAFNDIGHGRAELASYVRNAELEQRLARDPFPEPCSIRSPRQDVGAMAEYAQLRGVDPAVVNDPRFRGGWHVCTERTGATPVTWESKAAIDGPSHLYGSIKEVLKAADDRSRDPRRALHPAFVTDFLRREVDNWAAMMKGHTTERSLTEAKLRELALRFPSCDADVQKALAGDLQSRQSCLIVLRRHEPGAPPTWSLWTSRGSSADTRLVISARAIDALSYHQLHRDARTRYLSVEGARTPARDAMLNRALSMMPERSTIIVAADAAVDRRRSQHTGRTSGDELARVVGELARHHSTLRVEVAQPRYLPTWNRELDLHTRTSERPSPTAPPLASPMPVRAAGLDR